MGRSYWFECPECGYRAKVSGRADRGLSFFVQTILCRDCRELYDAVTRLRVPDELGGWGALAGWGRARSHSARRASTTPPSFQVGLEPVAPDRSETLQMAPFQTPVSGLGDFTGSESWNEPDRCPKCGVYLEKSALPYRLWD